MCRGGICRTLCQCSWLNSWIHKHSNTQTHIHALKKKKENKCQNRRKKYKEWFDFYIFKCGCFILKDLWVLLLTHSSLHLRTAYIFHSNTTGIFKNIREQLTGFPSLQSKSTDVYKLCSKINVQMQQCNHLTTLVVLVLPKRVHVGDITSAGPATHPTCRSHHGSHGTVAQ